MQILIVSPGITYFPANMSNSESYLASRTDGAMDQCAHLVAALAEKGLDVHVALPDYRSIDDDKNICLVEEEVHIYKKSGVPEEHIHLAKANRFIQWRGSAPRDYDENMEISFAFQYEVLTNIIPNINPNLIHCHDWFCGLIPAAVRIERIPCLLTLHNVNTYDATISQIEGSGISVRNFWHRLFFKKMPNTYEDTKGDNSVDLLASAIFSAHFIHTGSLTFLKEVAAGRHNFIPANIEAELTNKMHAGCAEAIPIPLDPECGPQAAPYRYDADDPAPGKRACKKKLQSICKLDPIDTAPLFFWPSRLDAYQKGCHLLTDILYEMIERFWDMNLQIVFVADGVYKKHFEDIVRMHRLDSRVAVAPFDKNLARLAYAASDFLLLPSLFETCGLPAMTGLLYGSLPVAHDTGGLHDTVRPFRGDSNQGNGFLFQEYNPQGLCLAIEQAMDFYRWPAEKRTRQISRIMKEGRDEYHIDGIAQKYIGLYEKMLKRPISNTL